MKLPWLSPEWLAALRERERERACKNKHASQRAAQQSSHTQTHHLMSNDQNRISYLKLKSWVIRISEHRDDVAEYEWYLLEIRERCRKSHAKWQVFTLASSNCNLEPSRWIALYAFATGRANWWPLHSFAKLLSHDSHGRWPAIPHPLPTI